ncbi:hypothetical protein LTR86_004190 [Recurvomyces mirabilis]|nr:hypothetical protein LTR86_004190 [Recurvomyces mirabilis]
MPDSDTTRPPCGSAKTTHPYNTPLHILALLLILTLSTLACSFPLLARRFPSLPIPSYTLFLSRHFGTGVLLATAFVHLLPTAYTSLTDPCLPRFWNEVYPAMSGFVAMVSVMVVVGIEMVFASKGAKHSHGGMDFGELRAGEGQKGGRPEVGRRSSSFRRFQQGSLGQHGRYEDYDEREDVALREQRSPRDTEALNKPLPPEPPLEDEDSDLDLDSYDPMANEDQQPLTGANGSASKQKRPSLSNGRQNHPSRSVSFAGSPTFAPSPSPLTSTAAEQRAILQCLLLEAGILFHSVFIGMALSVSTGPAFLVLLVAISFHQTFEGLALGSRIAAISSFSTSSPKPWLMSLMYGVTTPIGQAIGLAVHTLYDPASQFGLLMVGLVNAISAGLLLYAGLVQLLAEDFLSDQSYHDLHGRRRLEACGAVICGSMLMAFVGAFA